MTPGHASAPHPAAPFAPPMEAAFQAARRAALAEVNAHNFWMVALLVISFSAWDWYVDPANWARALAARMAGVAVILTAGITQIVSRRSDWSPALARVRFAASVLAVAGALALLDRGYVVGLAGLVAVFLAGPYIALDRRDYLKLNIVPLIGVAAIMAFAGLDRFTVVNAWTFLVLTLVVGLMLARVFEATNRRAFALEQALMREARTDALTGLANRRAMEEAAAAEVLRAARSARPLAIVLADIDHFKRVNDELGHDDGDRVIRAVGARLASVVRATDTVSRWGGEEFLVLLPETPAADATLLAERMRASVADARLPEGADFQVTVSLGVAGAAAEGLNWPQLLKAADRAMYRAKAAGRNRVEIARGGDG